MPISRRNRGFSALGNLSLNGNAEVDQLSDFGTLTTIGAGVSWSPVERLNLLSSWTREEGPPTINQLGDPILETPGTRIFDFTPGETVLATVVTGADPDLKSDRRTVIKLGANWQPFENADLRFRAEYVHQKIDNPISSLNVTSAIEQAFPDRFTRDASGHLIRADLRPVNFESSERSTLRIGFDFSKPLKSHRPSQSVLEQMRAQFRGPRGTSASPPTAQPSRRMLLKAVVDRPRRRRRPKALRPQQRRGRSGWAQRRRIRRPRRRAVSAAATGAASPSRSPTRSPSSTRCRSARACP